MAVDLLELRRIFRIRRIERNTWDLTPSLVNQQRSWVVTYTSFGKLRTVTSTELAVVGCARRCRPLRKNGVRLR